MTMKTPAYVIEEDKLRANLKLIHDVQTRAGVQILIALKAFAFYEAFPIIKEYFPQGAASSYNEARLIFEELGGKAHTFSTVFYDDDFDEVCRMSDHLIFNSVSQLKKFRDRAIQNGISFGLRVNPEWSDVTTDLYNPAASTSRLGVTADSLGDFWDDAIEGLHFHVLCESNSHSLESALKNLEKRFGDKLSKIKWINLGGGHLMTSKEYDVEHLIRLLIDFRQKYNIQIYMEPGSAFVWQTGSLFASVIDIVENGGETTANLDISFTCHMPDCLEMPYKPAVKQEVEISEYEYTLGGTSCLAGDFIRGFHFAEPLKVGDQLEFLDMIHYTLVKTTHFNGVRHPSVYLQKTDGSLQLLKKYDYTNYKLNM